jgi:hypothetical protein
MREEWPVAQIRIARPTARMEAVVRFYRDGLGLPILTTFSGHAGYSGVMLGLPAPRGALGRKPSHRRFLIVDRVCLT